MVIVFGAISLLGGLISAAAAVPSLGPAGALLIAPVGGSLATVAAAFHFARRSRDPRPVEGECRAPSSDCSCP